MVRRHRIFWVVLAGWLVGACIGGQTGEPTSDDCTNSVRWQQSLEGVSPEQLALTYRGEHPAKLHWSKNPEGVSEPVTLTLSYPEQSGAIENCFRALSVAVNFSLRAKDGALIDSGQGSLSAARGVLEHADYSGRGQHFRIVGNFNAAMGEVTVSGVIEPGDPATADSADFSSYSDNDAGGI
jgi:hypothetical protein